MSYPNKENKDQSKDHPPGIRLADGSSLEELLKKTDRWFLGMRIALTAALIFGVIFVLIPKWITILNGTYIVWYTSSRSAKKVSIANVDDNPLLFYTLAAIDAIVVVIYYYFS